MCYFRNMVVLYGNRAAYVICLCAAIANASACYSQANTGGVRNKPRYEVVDLGAVVGHIGDDVIPGLNSKGHVTLWHQNESDQTFSPILWTQSGQTSFKVPLGYHNAFAISINDGDTAVGWANTSLNPVDSLSTTHAFLFDRSGSTDLGTLGGHASRAYSINSHNVIVGVSELSDRSQRAFKYVAGTMIPLSPLPGGKFCIAFHVNEAGWIVGASKVLLPGKTAVSTHATLWRNHEVHDLGSLMVDRNSTAYGINKRGDVVGEADLLSEQSVFLFSHGKMKDLKIDGRGYSINDRGQIVGAQEPESGTSPSFAFLWQQGRDYNLNECLTSAEGVHLLYAYQINNDGQIMSMGTIHGELHAFLLTPAPQR